MKTGDKNAAVLFGFLVACLALTVAFVLNLWGRPPILGPISLVDPKFTEPSTFRKSYAELVRTQADLSDFDCYACHDRKNPPPLRFDTNQNIIVPSEHANVVMAHGQHGRNNNCFNCHDEQNLEQLQTRDGRQVTLADSPHLCGSCHGPTYRDWEAGAHGRTEGFWSRTAGPVKRLNCVDCHDPHQPKIPPRQPAPGPHPLHRLLQAPTPTAH